MKTLIILVTTAVMAVAAVPAGAQTTGSAMSGMGSAEQVLQAEGKTNGVNRIERAKCFSGMGACNAKYRAIRDRAKLRRNARTN